MAEKGQTLRFELRSDTGDILNPEESSIATRDFSKYVVHKLLFLRDPSKDYNLYAWDGEKLLDQRLIGKGPVSTDHLKIAVTSCMSDHYSVNFKIWETLSSQKPDYLLMIGDNVYADKAALGQTIKVDPERLWSRYVDVRTSLPIFFQKKLIPIHAVWDDHDYGQNNATQEFEYKNESLQIFQDMYAQSLAEENFTKGLGVGGLLSLGNFNLYFIDGRSFRSSGPTGKHLGIEQEAWLLSKLKEEITPSFIIKGDQFFGGYDEKDSFEGKHPQDFALFTAELAKIPTPFIFLSGDRHFSEIMQFPRGLFGKPSFEITSSPMHTGMASDLGTNPWRVVGHRNGPNFVIIDNKAQDNHWFLNVESIGEKGEVYFRRELAVFIKDLQNNLNEIRKRRHGKRRFRRSRRR